jgi:hypothetical protein
MIDLKTEAYSILLDLFIADATPIFQHKICLFEMQQEKSFSKAYLKHFCKRQN